MKVFKKNQVVAFTIGLMVLTAGYLSFTNNGKGASLQAGVVADSEDMASIGDAKLVSANVTEGNEMTNQIAEGNKPKTNETNSNKVENVTENKENINTENTVAGNTIETDGKVLSTDEYFMNSRLERNTMYSQQIENYQNILNNTNVSEAQKKVAQEEIIRINNEQNAIMIVENLIRTKGIKDLIVFINQDSVNVIIKGKEPKKEEIAQIQNIITRELKADIGDVHIMNKE